MTRTLLPFVIVTALLQSHSCQETKLDHTGCGKTKGCLYAPPGCHESEKCLISFSYQVTATVGPRIREAIQGDMIVVRDGSVIGGTEAIGAESDKPDEDHLLVELDGKLPESNGYIAVGFSKDAKMGNDMVLFCAGVEGNVDFGLAVNAKPTRVVNPHGVMKHISSVRNNDQVYCKMRHKVKPPENRTELFDLSNPYYILLARGPFESKGDKSELKYHTQQGRWVAKQVPLSDVSIVGNEGDKEVPTGEQGGTAPSGEHGETAAPEVTTTKKKATAKLNTIIAALVICYVLI